MLSEYFATLVDMVIDHEGAIDEYRDDASLRWFGGSMGGPQRIMCSALGDVANLATRLVPLVVVLAACQQPQEHFALPCETRVWYRDTDGDGFGDPELTLEVCNQPAVHVALGTDCDDDDPAIYPGAPEPDCTDPVDYDCDGETAYADADGDGWAACEDCDDTSSFVRPDHEEWCNGIDDDCDGEIDEDDAINPDTWYVDADGDGFGDPGSPVESCDPSDDVVDDSSDCDDTDPAINPDGSERLNGQDDDCDGVIDLLWESTADGALLGVVEGARLGGGLASGGDLTGDGLPDVIMGLQGDDAVDKDLGTLAIWSGPFSGTVDISGAPATLLGSEDLGMIGEIVVHLGDLDGDGYSELLVGAPYAEGTGGEDEAGAALLLYGPITGAIALDLVPDRLTHHYEDARLGSAVARLDDVDGEGNPGLFLGAKRASPTRDAEGQAYVVALPEGGGSPDDALATFVHDENYGLAGYALLAGRDLTGDGVDDYVVSIPGSEFNATWNGRVAVVAGPVTGTVDLALATATLTGETDKDSAGVTLAWAGDDDGDGLDDLFVGAPSYSEIDLSAGRSYLVRGPVSGARGLADAAASFDGPTESQSGSALVAGVDLDGDDHGDLLVGAQYADVSEGAITVSRAGATYLTLGPFSGNYTLVDDADAWFFADTGVDALGSALLVEDLDQDSVSEVLIGALTDDAGAYEGGALFRWVADYE